MKRTHFSFFLLVVLLLSMITACTKLNWEEINEMEYNTSIGIPLGKIEASVVNLLAQVDDSLLVTNPESGNCYLYWKQEDQRIDFNIANFTVGGSLKENILISDHLNTSITSNITIPKGEKVRFIVNYDYDFVFNETGEESVTRVDSMLVASSELNCQYNLTDINIGYTMPLKMIITFPGIDDLNGYTIERLISVVNGQFNETVSNYLVYFGNNQTLTPIEIAFEVISDGTLTLSPSSSIELTSQFRLINARVAWGYFFHQGPVSRDNISKELPNEIFDNPHITNNQLLFSNPQINFNIISNIGMPLFFEFSNVYAVGKNNERVYADFNGSTSYTMPIAQPDVMFQTSSQEFLFDRENGQTNRLFEITPQELHYSWAVSTPDYVATEDIVHYLVEPIDLRMQMEVILPLQLDPTSYFIYSDTLISDISAMIGMDSLSENMRIEVIKLYLDYTNKMPLSCTATARFMDENMEVVHQYEEITIESAKIDSHGAATEASMGEIIIEIADEDISNILKTKEIILDMKFTGYNEDSKILITTEDKVNIHVSLFAKAGIKIELDNK